jgi:predicted aspartyl protease
MRATLASILLIPSLVLVPGALAGAPTDISVYRWVDDDGTLNYASGLDRVPERHRGSAELVPASPADVVVPAAATVSRLSFVPGEPILVSARIGGAGPITMLLDTGADRTLVSPATLHALGLLAESAGRTRIKGVAGGAEADVVWVSSLEVGNARTGPLPIIAHDAGLDRAQGLLGRDFLDRFRVTIDSQNGVVILAPPR